MENPRPTGRGFCHFNRISSGNVRVDTLEDAYVAAQGTDVDFAIAVTADVQVIVLAESEIGIKRTAHGIQVQFKSAIGRQNQFQITGHAVYIQRAGDC